VIVRRKGFVGVKFNCQHAIVDGIVITETLQFFLMTLFTPSQYHVTHTNTFIISFITSAWT